LTLLAAAVSATAPAVAQETEIEQIIVTGSRIASSSLESASPLQVIGAQDIDESGVVNIQDLLLKSPAFGTPGINRTNSNFSTSSAGVATVDLRNLGTARTLVLVNGRRFVAGIPGETAVDLNTIPTQFIERVDILTGGASAVYGSDAIAGVVNIIYKKNFEGVEFGGQYGISNQGDSDETQFNVTMGTNVADGKGNIIAHLGYSDQGAVFSRDRSRSAVDQISYAAFGYAYTKKDFFTALSPFLSSFAPPGRFFSPDWNGDGAADTSNTFVDGVAAPRQGFNRSAFRTIAIPTERYLAAVSGSYEIVEDHSAFVEATYASTQAKTELEPFPLASADVFSGTGGQMPIEHAFYTPDGLGGFTQTIVRNPLVPSYFWDTQFRNVDGDDDTPLEEVPNSVDSNGDGLRDVYFTRRMAEIGNRGNVADRDTFRLVGGMQGSFLDNAWNYEAFYAYGQTKEAQTSSGQVNVLNFKYALDAIPVLDEDGNITDVICADPDARAQGCVPADIFGAGVMSPEAAKYIAAPGLLTTFTSQKVAGLNISGEPFELWAGPVGLAFGAEYREEYARSEFDALQQAGLNAGNAIPRTEGDFHVMEEYFEVNVPLLNDVPFAEQLDFRGAMRFSDYSTVGNTQSWNVGLEWSPISSIRFRAIQAESLRAPNINELFSPPSQDFPTGLIDPCLGVTATSTGTVDENCRAAPGVNQNIAANGAFALNQADIQGVSGFNRGNPNLEEEKGESLTLGVVIQPEGIAVLEDFAFTIDYFDISIEDAIVSTPRQFILEQCYNVGNLCEFIIRRPNAIGANSAGSLEFIDSGVTNSGELGTEGIDVSVTYNNEIGPGDFRARLSYTHLLDGFVTPLPGAAEDPFAGEVGASEDRAYLQLGYNWGDVGITWGINYIGKAYLDDQFLTSIDTNADPEDDSPNWAAESVSIDEVIYHDVQVTWSPGDIVELYIGATNLFDENPPRIISGLPGNDTGTETDAGTYDPIGQRFYAGIRARF
jgi:outer membrane receptor protein involved in Fe transport